MLHSVRGRATVVAVGVSAAMLVLCGVLAVLLIRGLVEVRVTDLAGRVAGEVSYLVGRSGLGDPLVSPSSETDLVQIVSADGQVLAATARLRGRPPLLSAWPAEGELRIDRSVWLPYLPARVWVTGFRVPGHNALALAAIREPLMLAGPALPLTAAGLMVPMLALIGAGTWRTIGAALAPVEGISRELGDITARQLDRRVPVPETGGEVQRLAESINDGLARLEQATERERRFVADASHDLRNPIAGMRTTLEVALDEPEPKPLVEDALRHTERLNDIVVDLLELARLDAGAEAPVTSVDLAELVRADIAYRMPSVPIELELEAGLVVTANRLRLSRLLNNLVANAERHARSRIVVVVARDGEQAVLEVCDDGSGIPEGQRELVFERFARLEESKVRDPHGTGLGLPIAREIAAMYGGTLVAASTGWGARLVLRLPLA